MKKVLICAFIGMIISLSLIGCQGQAGSDHPHSDSDHPSSDHPE